MGKLVQIIIYNFECNLECGPQIGCVPCEASVETSALRNEESHTITMFAAHFQNL